jgi:hypothetical protein
MKGISTAVKCSSGSISIQGQSFVPATRDGLEMMIVDLGQIGIANPVGARMNMHHHS